MTAIFKKYKITYTKGGVTKTYFFLGNPKTYTGIGTGTGVDDTSDAEEAEVESSVEKILGSGFVVRAKIYYKVGAKRKTAAILIPSNKFVAFRKSMAGKTYNGGTVTSVRQPRRATSY